MAKTAKAAGSGTTKTAKAAKTAKATKGPGTTKGGRTPDGAVEALLDGLPERRREEVAAVRSAIRRRLPRGYEEGVVDGSLSYHVPHAAYPAGYHCDARKPVPYASVRVGSRGLSVDLLALYMDPSLAEWFREAWRSATDRRLDMGGACVRLSSLDGASLEVIGEAVAKTPMKRFIEMYESGIGARAGRGSMSAGARKKGASKQAGSKETTSKKAGLRKKVTKKSGSKKAGSKKKVAKRSGSKKSASKKVGTRKVGSKKGAGGTAARRG